MLTVSNLSHLKASSLGKMLQQFEVWYRIDLKPELQARSFPPRLPFTSNEMCIDTARCCQSARQDSL